MNSTNNHKDSELRTEGVSETELKKNPFKTPEGYFENLTPRVMESIRASEVPTESSWPTWLKLAAPTLGLAATVIAIWFFTPPNSNETPDFETVLASVTLEEIALYAEAEPAELVKYNLVEYQDMELNEVTEEELLEYLESQGEIDMITLINEIEI